MPVTGTVALPPPPPLDVSFETNTKLIVGALFVGGVGVGVVVSVTVTAQVAVLFPSEVLTVMVADPLAFALIGPLSTVATVVLFELNVKALFVAFVGVTVAVKISVFPTVNEVELLFKETPVTGTVVDPPPPLDDALTLT